MGIDRAEFRDQVGLGETPPNWFPLWPGFAETLYTPLEKCPPSVQELYEYDPVKARQLLDDAGYPDGLKINLWCDSEPWHVDSAAMFVDQMAKIGLDVSLVVLDTLVLRGHRFGHTYDGMMWIGAMGSNNRPESFLSRKWLSNQYYNYSAFADPEIDAKILEMSAELDQVKRYALIKDLVIDMMDLAVYFPVASARDGSYMWPWVKNWYGEVQTGDHDPFILPAYYWIDEDMKKEMGY